MLDLNSFTWTTLFWGVTELKIREGVELDIILRPWLTGWVTSGRQCGWPWPGPVPVAHGQILVGPEFWAFQGTCLLGAWFRFASYLVLLRTTFVHCGRGMAKWQALLLLFVWSKRGLFLLGLQSPCACVRARRQDIYDRAEEGIGSSSWCVPLPSCAPQIFCLIPGVLSLFIQSMSPKTRDSYCLKLLRDMLLNFLIFLYFVILYINM